MPEEPSRSAQLGERGVALRQQIIEMAAKAYGGRPSDAEPLSHEEELRLWMLPTSPAAQEAFKRGATMDEAAEANRMWAEGMKAQQQRMLAEGAKPADVHAAGFSDEAIFKVTREHAYTRGKANSRDDPKIEAEWHDKMAQRAAKLRAGQVTYTDVPIGEGVV